MENKTVAKRSTRNQRINLRSSLRQEQILRQAAAATDKTVTDFVLDSAVLHAERVLADRRWFLVDDEHWQRFQELLDDSPRETPKLASLLGESSPFSNQFR